MKDKEEKEKIIEQQAKEIEALREIIKDMYALSIAPDNFLKACGLIDENGNPTRLLTGGSE